MRKKLIAWGQSGPSDEEILEQWNHDRCEAFERENKPDTFWAKAFLVVAVLLSGFFWLWLFPTVFGN